MDPVALHLEVRNAIVLADELGRHEHARGDDTLAGHLAAIRTALADLERVLGRHDDASSRPEIRSRLSRLAERFRERIADVPHALRSRVELLLATVDRITFAEHRPSAPLPAKPVLRWLPIGRVVPQSLHSVVDYAVAGALLASAAVARTPRARFVGAVVAAKVGGIALFTDARLALARILRIELHEGLDHALAITTMIAPYVLRYHRRDRLATKIQVGAALGLLLVSLATDYRAARGVSRPVRSRGGPTSSWGRDEPGPRPRRRRVAEAQRPLEGLANPSVLPRIRV